MPEQVEQQKALHLEPDVGVDDDLQAVEDAGARRFEIPILDRESILDDAGRDRRPDLDELVSRHLADARADDFVAWELLHGE
jgi:hypothetical protein